MSSEASPPPAAPGESSGQQNQPGQSSTQQAPAPLETTNVDILRAANVPDEVVKAFQAQAEPEQGKSAEQPEPAPEETGKESEAEPSTEDKGVQSQGAEVEEPGEKPEESGTEQEPSDEPDEGDQEPAAEKQPTWYQKRLGKWKRKEQKLQDQLDEAREKLAEVEAERQKQPAQPQQQPAPQALPNELTAVETLPQLDQTVTLWRQVRDVCLANRDGFVSNAGTDKEQVVSAKEVADNLVKAMNILDNAGVRAGQIQRQAAQAQERRTYQQLAQSEWPELYERGSEVNTRAELFLQQHPEIGASPYRDFILGLMAEGWKTFKPRWEARLAKEQQQQPNGQTNGQQPKQSLPEALKRKIPPIPKTSAPNPPRGSRVPSPIKNAEAAVQNIVATGATPESIQAAIAAIEAQNRGSSDTRTPAPV